MRRALIAALAAAAIAPSGARAEAPAPDEVTPAGSPPPQDEPAGPPEEEIEVTGRVFVRDTYSTLEILGDRVHRHERSIDDARVQLEYRRKDYLELVIEADVGDDEVDLKDAYIRVEPRSDLRFVAGHLKRPMSVIALDSKWDLPSTERGLLSTLEVDGEDLPFSGGRGVGALARYRAPGSWKPTVTAALFQNPRGTGDAGLDASDELAQDAYLRAAIEPVDGLDLATSFAILGHLARPGQLDSYEHAPIASLEARLERDALQVWIEGYVGAGLFADDAPFWAARTIASPRFERRCWPKRIEPFVSASIFDPDVDTAGDGNAELGGGLNLAFTKYLRLTADVHHRFAQGSAAPAIAGTVARLQLGARFAR